MSPYSSLCPPIVAPRVLKPSRPLWSGTMIPVGQPYRPAGTLDVRSIFITLILGTTGALLGAALVWLWAISPIPTILLVTSMFQGLGVGLVMLFPVYRLRIRNPRLVGFVGFACGLISIVLVHYGLYIHMRLTTAMAGAIRHEITEEKT